MSQDFVIISTTLLAVGRSAALSFARESVRKMWFEPLHFLTTRYRRIRVLQL